MVMAHVALGNVRIAKQYLDQAEDDVPVPDHVRILLKMADSSLAVIQERARAWPLLSCLTPESRNAWMVAEQNRLIAESHAELRHQNLATAALYYSKSAETQLRACVFGPYRAYLQSCEKGERSKLVHEIRDADPHLGRFVTGIGEITMGQMLGALENSSDYKLSHFWNFVSARFPSIKDAELLSKLQQLKKIGNGERHLRVDESLAIASPRIAQDALEALLALRNTQAGAI
jgi:hypothetical protein